MRFSVTSLLGQWGQICFSEFLKIISSFFCSKFLYGYGKHPTLFWKKENGFFCQNLALWPPRSIVGVGDKHAHDSDHAECLGTICVLKIFVTAVLTLNLDRSKVSSELRRRCWTSLPYFMKIALCSFREFTTIVTNERTNWTNQPTNQKSHATVRLICCSYRELQFDAVYTA